MADLPIKVEPETRPVSGLPTPYREPASLDASGVAAGLNQVQALWERNRAINAQFAADDADLAFAKQAGELWANFRTKHGMDPTANLEEAKAELEKAREDQGKALTDPLARRAFESASRRRLEGHLEQFDLHAATERERFQAQVTDGKVFDAMDDIRLRFTDPAAVSAGIQKAIAASDLYFGEVQGMPQEELNSKAHTMMIRGVETALNEAVGAGVDDPNAAQAGLALLHGKLKFGDQEVDVSELLGARAKMWEKKLKGAKSDGDGVTLGVQAYVERRGEAWLQEKLKKGEIGPTEFAKASAQYTSLVSHAHERQNIADEAVFKAAADHLASVGWDIERYKATFGREYGQLGGDKAKLETLAASMGRKGFNQDQERTWTQALDRMTPGWTDGLRLESFLTDGTAASLGPQHWDEFTREFNRDRNRPADQDGSVSTILGALDTRLRQAFKVEKSNGMEWDSASTPKINARNWAVAQMQHLVASHHETTRKQGAASQDPTWYIKPMDEIINAAKEMERTKVTPATPGFNRPRQGRIPAPFPTLKSTDKAGYDALPAGAAYKIEGDSNIYYKGK